MSKNTKPRNNSVSRAPNNPRSTSLVARAYNNPVIVKNEQGEYQPIGIF